MPKHYKLRKPTDDEAIISGPNEAYMVEEDHVLTRLMHEVAGNIGVGIEEQLRQAAIEDDVAMMVARYSSGELITAAASYAVAEFGLPLTVAGPSVARFLEFIAEGIRDQAQHAAQDEALRRDSPIRTAEVDTECELCGAPAHEAKFLGGALACDQCFKNAPTMPARVCFSCGARANCVSAGVMFCHDCYTNNYAKKSFAELREIADAHRTPSENEEVDAGGYPRRDPGPFVNAPKDDVARAIAAGNTDELRAEIHQAFKDASPDEVGDVAEHYLAKIRGEMCEGCHEKPGTGYGRVSMMAGTFYLCDDCQGSR